MVVPAQFLVWGILFTGTVALLPSLLVYNVTTEHREFMKRWNKDAPADLRETPGTFPWGTAVFVGLFTVGCSLATAKFLIEPKYTEYKVFSDRVEFSEGLLNRIQRTVVFDQVLDVHLTEGVLQQTKGVGSVTLVSNQLVSAGKGHLTNLSFDMWNVPEPQQVYELIRSLALKKGPAEPPAAPDPAT